MSTKKDVHFCDLGSATIIMKSTKGVYCMIEIMKVLAEAAYKIVKRGRMLKRIKKSVNSINQNSNLDIGFNIRTDGCLEFNVKTLETESDE